MKWTLRWTSGLLGLGLTVAGLAGAAPTASLETRPLPAHARPGGAVPDVLPGRLPAIADKPAADRPAAAAAHRPRRTSAAEPPASRRQFAERDLTDRTKTSAHPDSALVTFSPTQREQLDRLTDPHFLRPTGAAPVSPAGARRPAPGPDKDAPWSANTLLANPTSMNDDHVTLACSPDGNVLFAAFTAVDLGGTDRDVHVARSLDQGLTWQVWKLPSYSLDEYQPELAVDGGGYLHVVWIRDDGVILRARSSNPGDPSAWAWVKGLTVGEPCAVPSIAVTGAGDFAKVFIAADWLTVNYDYYQYEWTLIFMYSSNGGNTVTYDYFLPDGYPDYWPDVAMSARHGALRQRRGGRLYRRDGDPDRHRRLHRQLRQPGQLHGLDREQRRLPARRLPGHRRLRRLPAGLHRRHHQRRRHHLHLQPGQRHVVLRPVRPGGRRLRQRGPERVRARRRRRLPVAGRPCRAATNTIWPCGWPRRTAPSSSSVRSN